MSKIGRFQGLLNLIRGRSGRFPANTLHAIAAIDTSAETKM